MYKILPSTHHDLPSIPTRRSSDLHSGVYIKGHSRAAQSARATLQNLTCFHSAMDLENSAGILQVDHIEAKSGDRKSTRLNSSHVEISYAVFCLKKIIRVVLRGIVS